MQRRVSELDIVAGAPARGDTERSRFSPRSVIGAALKIIALVACCALLARTFVRTDWMLAWGVVERAGPWLPLVLLPFALTMSVDALALQALFRHVGHTPRYLGLLSARLSAEAISLAVPAGSIATETVNPLLYHRRCSVPASATVPVLAARRWTVMRLHALYIVLAVLLGWPTLAAHSMAILGRPGLGFLALVSALVPLGASFMLSGALTRVRAAARVRTMLERLPFGLGARARGHERAFAETDANLERMAQASPHAGVATALLFAAWALESVETLVILRVLGVPATFAAVAAFEAGLSLVRSLAFFAPGGLGVLDAGYMAVIGAIAGDAGVAAAFVVVKRAKELVWIGIGGALLAPLRGRQQLPALSA